MLEWHSNYAHFYTDAASYRRMIRDDLSSLERGLQSGGLGYRLVLCEAAYPDQLIPGALLVLHQKWINHNVGRCYKRYPLQVTLVDERGQAAFSAMDLGFDQTGWVQGETYELRSMFQLPKDISTGIYDLRIALADWQGVPQIRLGIAGDDGNKRYQIGKIRIV